MKIATWNVNSIRQRLGHLLDWIDAQQPDVLLLQETKITDDQFPALELEAKGYALAFHGQKTFNGVAILSKYRLEEVHIGLPGDESDTQSRYIEARVMGPHPVRVASIYLPNGQAPDSDKYGYKLGFFARLHARAAELLERDEPVVLGGDYNVAPDEIDVYNASRAANHICFTPTERQALRALAWQGYGDAFRLRHPGRKQFSWWDYRGGNFEQNIGLRIDHLMLSPHAVDRLEDADVDATTRGWDKPSDHAPVWCRLAV